MWDSNAPLQLLKSMPKKLSKENLEKIQLVIDADKYKNSLISGFDLCGMYAPFCRGCKKTSIYPCAIAYINMMKAGGMEIEIDAKPVTATENIVFASKPITEEQPPLAVETNTTEETAKEEIAVAACECVEDDTIEEKVADSLEEQAAEENIVVEEVKQEIHSETPHMKVKRKIRIAVARKKI